jgi:hypothetical protein
MPIASASRNPRRGAPGRESPAAATGPRPPAALRLLSAAALFYFLVGLACRWVVFGGPHLEGDEQVYRALVAQLDAGHGYNLIGATFQGVTLIGNSWPADQYGRALFFHPPGGIALFWLLHRLAGAAGFPLAQILSYAVFYWSLLSLARRVVVPLRGPAFHAVAALAAFTPIMTHVTSRYWLDGPMLACTTLAAALLVPALERRSVRGVLLAAFVMGCASWIKTAAFAMLPGLLVLGWALVEPGSRRAAVRLGLVFAGLAVAIQLPWELWQWRVVGSAFPAWAGRPSPELVAANDYVYTLTVVRKPWIYLTLMPRGLWTLVPSLACMTVTAPGSRARRVGLALLAWIAVVLAVAIGLGLIGYSKLLRYAVLVSPATVLLFGLAAGAAWGRLRDPAPAGVSRARLKWLVALAAAGLLLEIAQGVFTPMLDHGDLIRPVVWPAAWLY